LNSESRNGPAKRLGARSLRRLVWIAALLAVCACDGSAHAQTAPPAAITHGSRVISGVVLSALGGQPLEGADVTLLDAKSGTLLAETTSDGQGGFAFSHLADGKYSLRATHRGYITSAFDEHDDFSTAIVTGEGLVSTGLKFAIKPLAVIYGTVTDESGDPVQQARVSLFRQDERNGTGKIVRAGAAVSDDLGNYEFPRLGPGNYYLAVSAQPWYATHPQPSQEQGKGHSPLDVAYATTFYADVTDSEAATPIPVKPGDRIPVNFTLHPVPAVHIFMQVPAQERGQMFGITMPMLSQDIFGSMEPGMQTGYTSRMEGSGAGGMITIELNGVAPGHYEMEFRSPRGEPGRVTSVDASSDHQVVDGSAGDTLADVTGKVAMAGGGGLPPRLSISLRPQQGDENSSARVERDGSFQIHGVRPGTYEVVPSAGDMAVAVTQITASGGTLDGHLLKVGAAPVMLAATLVESMATVSGFAKAGEKPASGAMIVLVPANPGANLELFRRDQSDSDGSFTLKRVIPGAYTLVAIEDGWTLDWARAEVIGHYLPGGLKVIVAPHSNDIRLKDAVAVQLK
jgi:hypothetical protein